MADAGSEGIGNRVPARRRPNRRRRSWVVVLIAVVTAAVVVSCSLASPPDRRYSDEELGLDELIDAEIVPFDARYRSSAESSDQLDETFRILEEEAVGHERERMHFENNLALVFWQADERNPPDRELLDEAYRSAMDECAVSAGFGGVMLYEDPDIDPERYQSDGAGLLEEELARLDNYEAQFGLDYESYLDLRHECAKQAASYPTLDPAVRDELLERFREHYRAAVYEYLREFPDAEVPLVDHEGSPRPLEDWLVRLCLKVPDPAECAEEYRVELPAE